MYPIDTQDGLFHDGDGVSELGTIVPAWWLNQMQAELAAVLTAAGITPAKADQAQVITAVRALISGQNLPVWGTYSATHRYQPGDLIKVDGNWYEAYHPDGCLGKDPRDTTNRPAGWTVTDESQPYYWIKLGQWLSLPEVGSPIYLPSTSLREGLIKYRNDGTLHKSKFWRLAQLYPNLVSGNYLLMADLRGEFLRGLDDGRGIDLNREINSTQLDAIENIKGQFQMQGFEGSIAISNTGPFYSERVGFNAAAGSYYGAYKALFDLSRSNRTANETRSRNIAMLAATRI